MKNVENQTMTDEAKAAKREYMKRWRAANKDKVKANNARYWAKKAKEAQKTESN